ncbi:MAG: InlB B-repeat-containing protein [Bacteroidales bacterium]|jgi:uncharacterized repeat protein (TIGR02543 family)|nr:InlB B-repeat-containing protein [Bacteroidales bacterium]
MRGFSYFVVAAMIFGVTLLTSCEENDDKPKEFTVSFNSNEGSEVSTQIVKENEMVIRPENPTRSGYDFLTWYKDADLVNEWNFDIDVVTADIILYAKWEERKRQKSLLPLSIGNSWSYENTSYNGGVPKTITTNENIQNSYVIDGITGFSFSEYKSGQPISLFENDENGNLVEYLFNNDKFVHSTILYKKDVKKGDNWTYKSAVYTNDDFSKYKIEEWVITCITSDTIISTPKGNYHCIGFSYHPGGEQRNGDPNHTMIDFLSENIGKVKLLHYEHDNGRSWLFRERVLIDFQLEE